MEKQFALTPTKLRKIRNFFNDKQQVHTYEDSVWSVKYKLKLSLSGHLMYGFDSLSMSTKPIIEVIECTKRYHWGSYRTLDKSSDRSQKNTLKWVLDSVARKQFNKEMKLLGVKGEYYTFNYRFK